MKVVAIATAAAVLLLLTPRVAEAKDPIEVWLEAGVRAELVDDLRLTVSNQIRFRDRLERLERVLPELKLAYRVTDWLRFDGGYRFTADKRTEGDFRYFHRLFVDARLRWEPVRDIELDYRMRLQNEMFRDRDDQRQNQPEWRHRLGATFAHHDLVQPGVSWELFTPFSNGRPLYAAAWRLNLGIGLDFGDHMLEPHYHYQRSIDGQPRSGEHVLGLGYRFDL